MLRCQYTNQHNVTRACNKLFHFIGKQRPPPPYILKKNLYGSGRFTRSVLARQNPRHFADPLKILIPAVILNNQFKSAYTIEDTNTIPVLHGSNHPVMNKIHITTNGVRKLLEGIKTHNATRPDNIPAHLRHILSHQLAPFLTRFIRLRDSTNILENSKYNTYFQEGRPS